MTQAKRSTTLREFAAFGLASWYGQPLSMERAHRHNEIELNFIEKGTMTYLIAGTQITVPARRLALFWGAVPHQVIHWQPPIRLFWITLPLGYFLKWTVGDYLPKAILNGQLLIDNMADPDHDRRNFQVWYADLNSGQDAHIELALMELEARLRRLSLSLSADVIHHTEEHHMDTPARMARYISEHYQEALSVQAIAEGVGLHPNYAMAAFRKAFGMSIVDYITQHRISHAQRLLLTTDLPVLEIGHEVGFGSVSRFYMAFEAICGLPPGRWRAALVQKVENRKNNL